MTAMGSARVFRPDEGTPFQIGADRFVRKGTPKQRSEAFSVIEYTGAANTPGPPPHLHRSFEEGWYILEGEVSFRTGPSTVRATPGTYLFVPRGVVHSFRVIGQRPARWLGIFSPGRYVGLIEELGKLLPRNGPPDLRKVGRLFRKYDTEPA